jgi:DNA polymerase
MTGWQRFVERWQDCQGCPLHEKRRHIVLAKGRLPCDVLFIGEAPGHSEDVSGRPFDGPAGQLLDSILASALAEWGTMDLVKSRWESDVLRLAWTNLCCCIPLGDDGAKLTEGGPPAESIKACSPRLREFVDLADPHLIICVGSVASDWLNARRWPRVELGNGADMIPMVDVVHPAAILRARNPVIKGDMIRKMVPQIRKAVANMMELKATKGETT